MQVLPFASVRASRTMHGAMARAVLRARVSWFEATPLGRVLNRFASDVSQIDQQIAGQFKDTVVMAFNVTGDYNTPPPSSASAAALTLSHSPCEWPSDVSRALL